MSAGHSCKQRGTECSGSLHNCTPRSGSRLPDALSIHPACRKHCPAQNSQCNPFLQMLGEGLCPLTSLVSSCAVQY